MSTVQTHIGIALYSQKDSRGRPMSPHWAIVAHPQDYFGHEVRVYQIRRDGANNWVLYPKTCTITNSSSLIGIIHVGTIQADMNWLDAFAAQYPAGKNGNDPGQMIVWSCSAWVIRFLWGLASARLWALPCRIEHLYDYIKPKQDKVQEQRRQTPHIIPVVPL